MKKLFTSAIAIALASLALSVPAQAAGSNWSVIGVWGSDKVSVGHGQGGSNGGILTLVGGSNKVGVVSVQGNGSDSNFAGTVVLDSGKVDVTTFQGGDNNIAGTLVVNSYKTSVYTEQTSDNNLSLVGVVDSSKVDVVVVQGPLAP